MEIYLADQAATESLGRRLAGLCPGRCLIWLHGDLGAGKTTLVRGFMRGLGYSGKVKSPTYTLVEPYEIEGGDTPRRVYHFDLYRLADPEELAFLGVEDYFADEAISLVEWPEQGGAGLPTPDIEVFLQYRPPGRQARLLGRSPGGQACLEALARIYG